ncbi:unnamed protein product, partial [Rotaria sp. Silwood1]
DFHTLIQQDQRSSGIMLFGSDGKKILWRKPDEEFGAECLVPRAQQNGGNWKV